MPRGGSSHDRRRKRRAAERNGAEGMSKALHSVPQAELDEEVITAGASGSTSLSLSDRETPWDAGAARKSLSDAQFGSAHFWKDPDKPADQITSYKLPFAKDSGGLTAIWRGVTAGAGRLPQSDIPSGDVAGVHGKMAAYYHKAAKQYDDPSIKPPWESSKADAVEILKRYEYVVTAAALDLGEEPDTTVAIAALANAEALGDQALFNERFDYWAEQYEETPEREALALVRAFADDSQVSPSESCDNCDHSASAHEGGDNMGACTIEGCDCDGMQPASEGSDSETATVTLGIDFTEEAIDEAASVLVEGATLVDAPKAYKTALDAVMDRVKFRLENIALDDVAAAAGEATIPEAPSTNGAPPGLRWTADAVFEGILTDDGRAFAPGSLSWRQLPLTLGAMLDTPHADVVTESRAAGSITGIQRVGNVLRAEGVFDTGEYGQEIARMVGDGTLRGISVDVAVAASEVAPKLDFFDEDGGWREVRIETSNPEADLLDVLFGDEEPPIYVVTEGTIGAITVCPFPAFADARIAIAASLVSAASPAVATFTHQHGMTVIGLPPADAERSASSEPEAQLDGPDLPPTVVTASAVGLAPVKPPAEWFENPGFEELTALTVTPEGMIYGHAALWDTCHIAIPDVCTTAPHSETDYDFFHLKEVECDAGERIHVGTITLDTGHAPRGLSAQPAVAHYDDTGTAVADVVCGEDEFGIWIAGALRSDVDAEQARKLQGAVLSGDWRRVEFDDGSGNLELVALLAVNVPGFPVPRTRAELVAGADGKLEMVTLTAAGIHAGTSDDERLEKVKVLGNLDAFRALAERARA